MSGGRKTGENELHNVVLTQLLEILRFRLALRFDVDAAAVDEHPFCLEMKRFQSDFVHS